jgi:predicted glycogen debranching enzyme
LIAPIGFEFELKVNESNCLIFSDISHGDYIPLVEQIEKRYKKLPTPRDIPQKRKKVESEESLIEKLDFSDDIMFEHKDYMKILEFSMRDFLANNDIIAGFPWFGCWGRDAMISMAGVLAMPKGAYIAHDILMKYAAQIKNGLIPNMCSESAQQANYISMDATLWFMVRLYEVCRDLTDNYADSKKVKTARLKQAIDLIENMLENILERPHQDFALRTDGLLELKPHFASATWMDAKIHDRAVTPRDGAPVEINALLFNALYAYEKMIEDYNALASDKESILTNQSYMEARSILQQSFQKFWIGDYLADRLVGDVPVREYRPNAIIAASLPFSDKLLSIEKLQQVYETAHVELYTPYGMRTLSPRDPKFQKKYIGNVEERDSAYHNGTVWAWLLLPFAQSYLIAFSNRSKEDIRSHVTYLIQKLQNSYKRGHIASVAEVWDGDKPHFPKGCPAQAWSVSALYSIERIIEEMMK